MLKFTLNYKYTRNVFKSSANKRTGATRLRDGHAGNQKGSFGHTGPPQPRSHPRKRQAVTQPGPGPAVLGEVHLSKKNKSKHEKDLGVL